MHTRTTFIAAASSAIALTTLAAAETVTYELIPNATLANDMSSDGRYVVGTTNTGGTYRWDSVDDVFLVLDAGAFDATAVSDDGQVILGCVPDPTGQGTESAGIWTAATGWQSIGFLPNAGTCPSRSNGYELSDDGTTAVGLSWDGCDGRGFMWTQATGMIELENLGIGDNRASAISADGSVIAGFAQGIASRTPSFWTGSGDGQLLDPPDGAINGEVRGVSDDGTVLLGNWDMNAFRWTAAGGVEVLGSGSVLPGWIGAAMDIDDAGTIVGFDFLVPFRRAWIQPDGVGPLRDLESYVEAHGGVVPTGFSLEVAQAISADGRFICGHSFGNAWLVTITPDCAGDTDNSGAVDIDDIVNVVLDFGVVGPNPPNGGDVNGDEVVDIDDIVEVVLAFGACPGA